MVEEALGVEVDERSLQESARLWFYKRACEKRARSILEWWVPRAQRAGTRPAVR
jgi:hypothetical protein